MNVQLFNEFILYNNLKLVSSIWQVPSFTREAHGLLLMIALQESNLKHRNQYPVAYARGFWQFERGCCNLLWKNETANKLIKAVSSEIAFPIATSIDIWEGVEVNDTIAVAVARVNLYLDPRPLPKLEDEEKCWQYYNSIWRPGKPNREKWDDSYIRAMAEIGRFYL